jgi:uncharacterized protein (TIGR02996 family)
VTPLAQLEARLLADRDDRAGWLVYADALQERGDPRGEVIALGERLRAGDATVAARYAERCRAARWPRAAPFPHMHYRVRFEQMFAELRARSDVAVRTATIESPDPDAIARWRPIAGAAWPDGMTELYTELSGVELDYDVKNAESVGGALHIPSPALWDHAALEQELWFDFTEPDSALHRIRPIDRFVPEAYTVLYLRSPSAPAEVAYHYCGEALVPTDLTYREWLECLFRARGAMYWIQLALGPAGGTTWVEDGIAHVARMFPDFDPGAMMPPRAMPEVPL